MVSVREARFEDIALMELREPDRQEVLALGVEPQEALQLSLQNSTMAFTAFNNGNPLAMFGVAPVTILGDRAIVWLLTTNEVNKCKKTFAKYSRLFRDYFLQHYPILENYVDARYKTSINWLKWCGAEFGHTLMTPSGIPFIHFTIKR